jgi:FlaA1/EpsC-like NDP-sugar epimerase
LKKKQFLRVLVDLTSWLAASTLATLLRFDAELPTGMATEIFIFGLVAALTAAIINYGFSLYAGKYASSSLEEVIALCLSTAITIILLFTLRVLTDFSLVPRSVPIVAGTLAIIFMLVSRILTSPRFSNLLPSESTGEKTLVYGAGIAGRQIVEQMLWQADKYNPIGFLDDDPAKSNLRIFGRRVMGNVDTLEAIVKKFEIRILIVAISGIDSTTLLDLERRCRSLNVNLRVIPTTFEIMSGAVSLTDISEISEDDLLGRRTIRSDDSEISKFISGKRVLVTGAGGSIGSEIVRQIDRYAPASLAMFDRDETALLNLQLSMDGTGLLTQDGLLLGDIRDVDRVNQVFAEFRPDIVFHAAALKHLTTLERFPEEAYKTNVVGTQNILDASVAYGVTTFVNISTDKAADPTSELGKSKLITERFTAGISSYSHKYISVRFGNVIGSNGSFIHTFRQQIKLGGPLTITHPDVTRYFMTVSEAVHLVLQSAIIGKNGETLILDMGEPVRILDIAKHMIEVSKREIDIVFTGLRTGEKLHENLVAPSEVIEVREHPSIMHTRVEPLVKHQE